MATAASSARPRPSKPALLLGGRLLVIIAGRGSAPPLALPLQRHAKDDGDHDNDGEDRPYRRRPPLGLRDPCPALLLGYQS